ncbi:MAG TPA: replicative DNA helicase [Acidaminococcaceae bacterium]|nr:replicative DNA helicase [Acidaminococcaceae bacterium]
MQDRVPPQNIEAEQSVIGAMLIDKNAVSVVTEKLMPEDFYRQAHQVIYSAMLTLHSRNEPIDMVTLIDELKKMNKLDDVGGVSYVTLLANAVPTAANAKYHAQIVEEKSLLRQLVEGGTAIAAMGYDGSEDVRDIMDQAEKTILRISNRKGGTDFAPISEVLTDTINHIQTVLESKQSITGVATGFVDLDKLTAGLHPSDFIILAARPSMGKTALALNIAQNVAIRGSREGEPKKRVAFFSLEMSREQLVQRMLCSEADVNAQRLRAGGNDRDTDNADLWNKLWVASDLLAGAEIFIDDTPGITIMEMRSKARRLQADGGLDLIVIDYLQLMQGSVGRNTSDNRQQEVSEISRGLKALARELNVPVLALSQLSRSVEARQVKKPMLSDLRESGSLEQDADIVMFLYRDDYYKGADEAPTHVTELIVAKHRNGPVGRVNLFFRNECTKFLSLSKREEDDRR